MSQNNSLKFMKGLQKSFHDLSRIWPFIRPHKRLIWVALFMVPVISLLQMSLPLIVKRTIDTGIIPKNVDEIFFGVSIGIGLVISEYIARAIQTLVSAKAVHTMIQRMRHTLIEHIMKLSSRFHDRSMSGALVTRATSDFDNLSESLNQGVLTSVVDLAVLTGALAGLFILNWKLALCSLVILPIVASIVVIFSRKLKKSMLIARSKIATLNAFTQECLYGVRTVKVLTAETAAQKKLDSLAADYRKAQMKSVTSDAFLFALLDGIASVTTGIVLWLSVTMITGENNLTVGVMVAFVQYIQNLFDPLKQLGNKIAMLQGAFTSIDRIFGILDQKEFIAGSKPTVLTKANIQFQNVSFRYNQNDESSPLILNQIQFELPQGKSLALVGATGSGKSTIIKLMSKLYDGYTGKILINNQDLNELSAENLRKNIAIVPQDIVLFEGSVLFNITLGNKDISHEEAINAATTVGLNNFVEKLPNKYEYEIKEGGANLSVGQRQLIAFARALAKKPKILILDEATSSVDPKSEMIIQNAIDKMLSGRTVIVIAHRLTTIKRCDEILVLEKGRILERGNHKDLLQRKEKYFRLYTSMLDESKVQVLT